MSESGPHSPPRHPKVFISYSHDTPEHSQRVLELANALRAQGVDAELDRYQIRPPQGWPRWCEEQLRPESANFVLVICTATYRQRIEGKVPADEGRGVFWEGGIIYDYIYGDKGNGRFIPILLAGGMEDAIPQPLKGATRYRLHAFDLSDGGYDALYQELTSQPAVTKPGLGSVVSRPSAAVAAGTTLPQLPPREVRTTFAGTPQRIALRETLDLGSLRSEEGRSYVAGRQSVGRSTWDSDRERLLVYELAWRGDKLISGEVAGRDRCDTGTKQYTDRDKSLWGYAAQALAAAAREGWDVYEEEVEYNIGAGHALRRQGGQVFDDRVEGLLRHLCLLDMQVRRMAGAPVAEQTVLGTALAELTPAAVSPAGQEAPKGYRFKASAFDALMPLIKKLVLDASAPVSVPTALPAPQPTERAPDAKTVDMGPKTRPGSVRAVEFVPRTPPAPATPNVVRAGAWAYEAILGVQNATGVCPWSERHSDEERVAKYEELGPKALPLYERAASVKPHETQVLAELARDVCGFLMEAAGFASIPEEALTQAVYGLLHPYASPASEAKTAADIALREALHIGLHTEDGKRVYVATHDSHRPPKESTPMDTAQKRFKVALSFPGERRAFVEEVAERLASRYGRDRVLYDKYHEAEFARPDLDTHLQPLYHDESELIVVFLCADYEHKEWCGLEWRAIRDLIKKRQSSTVMLLCFDKTNIPGLFSIDGYVWIGNRSPNEVVGLILQRMKANGTPLHSAAPQPAQAIPPSPALQVWKEKLDHYLVEEAKAADPEQKFRLRKLIEEAKEKVRENGGQP